MAKEDIEKIIKKVQLESDKRLEKTLKRHMGALIEEFQHRVYAIGEQYNDIKKTLDKHTKILDSHTETLDSHTKILDSHTEQIARLTTDVTVIKTKIKESNKNINELKSDAKELRADMLEVKSDTKDIKLDIKFRLDNKVDKKHLVDLEGRMRILEKSK